MENLWISLGSWNWVILAGLMLLVELAAPGIFFIWLALAAFVVGVIGFAVDLSWQVQLLIFAILSVIFVVVLRPRFQDRMHSSDQPNLNQRMLNYVGHSFQLAYPIVNGRGRLSIDDTLWEVEGPDSAAGQKVRVTGVDGTRLTVEAA